MQLSMLLTAAFTLIAYAIPTQAKNFPNVQEPIIEDCQQITRARIMTRTSFDISVVSTIYRTQEVDPNPTPHTDLTEEDQRLVFGVEGSGCDIKACTICRMLNNCSDGTGCTSCDLAYYCNQCPRSRLLPPVEFEGIHTQRTCSVGPGKSIPCDEVEEAIGERHETFHFGGR